MVLFRSHMGLTGLPDVAKANTALDAYRMGGAVLAQKVADEALAQVRARFGTGDMTFDIVIIDRAGAIIARAGA